MKKYLITDAEEEQVSLAEAKTHLRVFDEDEDAYIKSLISASRKVAESHTAKYYGEQTVKHVFTIEDEIESSIDLERPYVSITDVTATFEDDTTEIIIDYRVRDEKIYFGSLPSWETLEITQVVGGPASASVKAGMLLLIGHLFENREATTNEKIYDLPFGLIRLLNTDRDLL